MLPGGLGARPVTASIVRNRSFFGTEGLTTIDDRRSLRRRTSAGIRTTCTSALGGDVPVWTLHSQSGWMPHFQVKHIRLDTHHILPSQGWCSIPLPVRNGDTTFPVRRSSAVQDGRFTARREQLRLSAPGKRLGGRISRRRLGTTTPCESSSPTAVSPSGEWRLPECRRRDAHGYSQELLSGTAPMDRQEAGSLGCQEAMRVPRTRAFRRPAPVLKAHGRRPRRTPPPSRRRPDGEKSGDGWAPGNHLRHGGRNPPGCRRTINAIALPAAGRPAGAGRPGWTAFAWRFASGDEETTGFWLCAQGPLTAASFFKENGHPPVPLRFA